MVEEKLEVEGQLRASEELFRAIVQNSSDAVTVLDADGTVRYGSALGEHVLGYDDGFAMGLDALELVHPDDQAMVTDIMGRAFTEPGVHGPGDGAGAPRERLVAVPRGHRQQPDPQPSRARSGRRGT